MSLKALLACARNNMIIAARGILAMIIVIPVHNINTQLNLISTVSIIVRVCDAFIYRVTIVIFA